MNAQTKTLIFDIGGVLLDWNPRYLYRKLFEDEADMENFLTEVCSPEWNLKQDAGRSFAEATEELVQLYPDQASLIRAFDERWLETISGPIEATVNIVSRLQKNGYALYGLSNWSAEKFLVARHQFSFLSLFKDIVVSGEVKLIKPNPEIYYLLLERISKQAEECLFIDDSKANIDAAKKLGFHTIHFRDPKQLKRELVDYGFFL